MGLFSKRIISLLCKLLTASNYLSPVLVMYIKPCKQFGQHPTKILYLYCLFFVDGSFTQAPHLTFSKNQVQCFQSPLEFYCCA